MRLVLVVILLAGCAKPMLMDAPEAGRAPFYAMVKRSEAGLLVWAFGSHSHAVCESTRETWQKTSGLPHPGCERVRISVDDGAAVNAHVAMASNPHGGAAVMGFVAGFTRDDCEIFRATLSKNAAYSWERVPCRPAAVEAMP